MTYHGPRRRPPLRLSVATTVRIARGIARFQGEPFDLMSVAPAVIDWERLGLWCRAGREGWDRTLGPPPWVPRSQHAQWRCEIRRPTPGEIVGANVYLIDGDAQGLDRLLRRREHLGEPFTVPKHLLEQLRTDLGIPPADPDTPTER